MSSNLDFAQVIPRSFDEVNDALQVKNIGNSFVVDPFDEVVLTYVPSGNGAGQIQTVTYKLASTTVATLTLSYNVTNQLTSVVKT